VGAVATAALLVASLPAPDLGWLAWAALAPLHLACRGAPPPVAGALGLVAGALAALGAFGWMFEVPGFRAPHAALLAAYLGLYPAAWSAAVPVLARSRPGPVLAAPALWTALDALRGHAGFLAVSWGTLAHTQHRNLALLQVATLLGERAVTFLVALGGVALAEALARRRLRPLLGAAAVLALTHAGGGLALRASAAGAPVTVAAVQPRILPAERATAAARAATVDRLERLSRAARVAGATLIVWPETAVRDPTREPGLEARLSDLARDLDAWLVVGAAEFVKFTPAAPGDASRVRSINAAYVLPPAPGVGGRLGAPYQKRLLVPFGEYVPLEGRVPWPAWLVPRVFDSIPGEGPRVFPRPAGPTLGLLICWENLFGGFVREAVRGGADVLVQLTNDGWFGPTAAPYQHNLASVLRAVENRVPVVVASNTGPSVVIDAWGRVAAAAPAIFREAVVTATITPGPAGALYTRLGDGPAALAAGLLSLVALVDGLRRRGRARPLAVPRPARVV
jgi:apolipoprotein N-acyltransferase